MEELHEAHGWLLKLSEELSGLFQKVPGSPIVLRYIKSSYQNDPVRSLIELFLCLFAVRYLLAPSYSTQKKSFVKLTDEVCFALRTLLAALTFPQEIDELVNEWQPEPLVAPVTPLEEAENEKRPVIVGYADNYFTYFPMPSLTPTQRPGAQA